ncbi:MAG: serine/threonine protein kinase, partial [Myxococcales bacterium]|nr:serine/threonine protein kinase [Myxococcales bacterium]
MIRYAPSTSLAVAAHYDHPDVMGGSDRPGSPEQVTRPDVTLEQAEPTAVLGQRFGRFVLRDVLGVGGMGTVFEAHDTALDRAVALKLLHADLTAPTLERRLRREAQAQAKLSHPNVVQVFETGVVDERPFIAMELVRGSTLAQWQAQRRSWRECVEVYLQAGRGLAAAHAEGLVHRDFKPSNCILDESGRVRVLDFGLARRLRREPGPPSLDVSGDRVPRVGGAPRPRSAPGTLGYMSLEQLEGRALDAKSDQFSFCVSLFEAVHGQRPFSGESIDALMSAMLAGELEIPAGSARVPRRLQRLLERGLRARPRERWPSMSHVLRELERLVAPRRWRRWAVVGA